ncbi:MAG: ADP-ribosylglycohydrolase family protein [Spirochaetaceae bacterium]
MEAWERERELMEEAEPKPAADQDAAWGGISLFEEENDRLLRMQWYSRVPGSQAVERLMVAAVQAMENRGMRLPDSARHIEAGLAAVDAGDLEALHIAHMRLQEAIGKAEVNPDSDYWNYRIFNDFEELKGEISLPLLPGYTDSGEPYRKKLYGGWLAQIVAGALGTALEGYNTDALRRAFGEIRSYVVEPTTFNDDITFEIAFLKAVEKRGAEVRSADIAEQWVALIPFGWSAELVALRNLKQGILPPESGTFRNPFYEWVGAQMRGAVCGLVAPGDPMEAARLAWLDAEVSHSANGTLGEIFNAILVALGFVMESPREVLEATVEAIPASTEYGAVVRFALEASRSAADWEEAWRACEQRLITYNWVHAYPNASAEVVALWFGNGDFDETLHVNAMCGQDVDCSAAQALTVLGVQQGAEAIPERWKAPVGDTLKTYVRGMKELSIRELADWTAEIAARCRR